MQQQVINLLVRTQMFGLTSEEELVISNLITLSLNAILKKLQQKILKTQISSQNLSKMLKAYLLKKELNSLLK